MGEKQDLKGKIGKAHLELKKRDLSISEIKKQPYGQEVTFNDPDGNGWVLQQPNLQ